MLDTEYDIVNRITKELSGKNENIYASILSLKDEIKILDKKNNELQNQLFNIKNSNLENKNNQILFKENLDIEKVKKISARLKDKVDRIVDGFASEDNLYKYMIMSDFEEVKKISKEFSEVCSKNDVEKQSVFQIQVQSKKDEV